MSQMRAHGVGLRNGASGEDRSAMRRALPLVLLLLALLPLRATAELVLQAEIRGAITPATAAYFLRALDEAARQDAELLVLSLDTPGGLDSAMREMIQALLASPVPVAIHVSPSGARAASAGTYLLYASHVAAMAPGTNLGAATPVAIGPGSGGEEEQDKRDGRARSNQDAMRAKAVADATAYIKSLAQLRGRNAEWAEKAVRDAESLSATDAKKLNVIDVVAKDLPSLLEQIDGRTVGVEGGERRLRVAGARVERIVPSWQENLLAIIADPNVALLLIMIGVYGLLFEFYTPGMFGPGVIGGICLLLGMYGLAMLPLNVAGVALVILGIALMIAEAFMPSIGAVGIGGVVAFVIGALMLVDADIPELTVSWRLILPLAVASALILGAIGAFAVRARARPRVAGADAMLGASAVALEDFNEEGWVEVLGERWHARSSAPLARGAHARVTAVDGLHLCVEPERRET